MVKAAVSSEGTAGGLVVDLVLAEDLAGAALVLLESWVLVAGWVHHLLSVLVSSTTDLSGRASVPV